MKRAWIDILCDPVDGKKLKLTNAVIKDDTIVGGTLLGHSGNIYQIKSGIPILLPPNTQSLKSVESFAFEWNEWGFLYAKKNWLKDIIKPLLGRESRFKNKIVIDAGAGSGAQSRWMAEGGAKLVISLELSDTIFHRHKETIKGFEDIIFPIQCDIAHLPVVIKPDILYCINVLQHTKAPKKTFRRLSKLLNKKTIFLFNTYNKEGILGSSSVKVIRSIVKLLSFRAWKWLSFLLTLGIFALLKSNILITKRKHYRIHIPDNFKELWLDLYDAFGAHSYQFTLSKKEQLDMFRKANLKIKKQSEFGYVLMR